MRETPIQLTIEWKFGHLSWSSSHPEPHLFIWRITGEVCLLTWLHVKKLEHHWSGGSSTLKCTSRSLETIWKVFELIWTTLPILTLLRCSTVLKCFLTIRECHISLVVEFYKENFGSSCEHASESSLPGVLMTVHTNCVIGSSGKRETMHRVRTCGRRPDLEKVQNDKDLLCIDDTLTSLGAPWGQVLSSNCHYFKLELLEDQYGSVHLFWLI